MTISEFINIFIGEKVFMIRYSHNQNRNRIKVYGRLCILLVMVFFCVFLRNEKSAVKVNAEENNTMVYFSDGSSLQVEVSKDMVKITGTHARSNSKYSYNTTGFNMTLQRTGGMVEGCNYRAIPLLSKSESIQENVITTYYISRKSLYDAAYGLYREEFGTACSEEDYLKKLYQDGGISFYLHNVFQVIERTGGSGSTIVNRSRSYNNLGSRVGSAVKIPGIMNAIYDLYGYEWSPRTQSILPEFYDIHMMIAMEPCSAMICLTDENGSILHTVVQDYPLVCGAKLKYTLPAEFLQVFTCDETDYKLTEKSIRSSYVFYGQGYDRQTYSLISDQGLSVRLGTGDVQYMHLYPSDSVVYLVCEKLSGEDEKGSEDTEPDMEVEAVPIHISFFSPDPFFELQAVSVFDIEDGIPCNEKVSCEGSAAGSLLQADFVRYTGRKKYMVPVYKTYILHWREKTSSETYEEFTYEKKVVKYVPVIREFDYISVENVQYYQLASFCVENGALPEGGICGTYETNASVECIQYGDIDGHLMEDELYMNGIQLEDENVYGDEKMPAVPEENFSELVKSQIPALQNRSDFLKIGDTVILYGEYNTYEDSNVTDEMRNISELNLFCGRGKINKTEVLIPAGILNGTYYSGGSVSYAFVGGVNKSLPDILCYPIYGLKSIRVHTPVVCDGILQSEARQYCQLLEPSRECIPLVLDENGISSGFTVEISNTGYHSGKKGYGIRDYSTTYSTGKNGYIAEKNSVLCNEVLFPFDVFLDRNADGYSEDDIFYCAGEWILLGSEKVRFYLPMWVEEGKYEVRFRTVAVNGEDRMYSEEFGANRGIDSYVAIDNISVEVSGKLFGFSVYEICNSPSFDGMTWENQNGSYTEYIGGADEYGREKSDEIYRLPVFYGSSPINRNALIKPGYMFRFTVHTIGKSMCYDNAFLMCEPVFYWVDDNGNNRKRVDLFYLSRVDGKNRWTRIGSEEDCYEKWEKNAFLYSYKPFDTKKSIRLFSNTDYEAAMMQREDWNILSKRLENKDELKMLKQTYNLAYHLPVSVRAAEYGYPVERIQTVFGINLEEDFWIRNGYIIVSFEISAYIEDKKIMDYRNAENEAAGYCNMWKTEKLPSNKVDGNGNRFVFEPGDIFCFPVGDSIRSDYIPGGIY